jgi:hypothetical protein
MNSRLLPLNPPRLPFDGHYMNYDLQHLTYISMPVVQIGLFAIMVVAMVRFST